MLFGVPLKPAARGPFERLPWLSMGQLGMILLLVSISVLFVAANIAVLITHAQAPADPRPGLPWGTALSSVLLVLVSVELQRGLVAMRSNRFTSCLRCLRLATLAAIAFLAAQAWNARELLAFEGVPAARKLFYFSYGLLVGLHALHVLGGFVPLLVVQSKIVRREYSSSRHAGLTFCVQYWHYLGIVWVLLLGTLLWIV
jgi:cytochrome c oxidase subunit III